jgi:hypothetical protein
MTDDHDRLAIRAIIEAALPHHLTRTQIANEAETFHSSSPFKREFKMYDVEVGRGWKCTEETVASTQGRRRYEQASLEVASLLARHRAPPFSVGCPKPKHPRGVGLVKIFSLSKAAHSPMPCAWGVEMSLICSPGGPTGAHTLIYQANPIGRPARKATADFSITFLGSPCTVFPNS